MPGSTFRYDEGTVGLRSEHEHRFPCRRTRGLVAVPNLLNDILGKLISTIQKPLHDLVRIMFCRDEFIIFRVPPNGRMNTAGGLPLG